MHQRFWLGWLLLLAMTLATAACGDDDDDSDDSSGDDDDDDSGDDDADDDDTGNDDDTADDDAGDDDATPDRLDYIDPLIGTGGLGFGYASAYPGPKAPFGLLSLSPDTTIHGLNFSFNHFSGYYYADTQIRGFSHTHLYGTGATDLGALLLMPVTVEPTRPISEADYRSRFTHFNETAKAGYYGVMLDTYGVYAELATRGYAAIHRYTFPPDKPAFVVVDPSHAIDAGTTMPEATILVDPATSRISGEILVSGSLTGRHGGVRTYYVMEFSEPFASYTTWDNGNPHPNGTIEAGEQIGAYIGFADLPNDRVLVRVALSYQSLEQAEANLEDQMPDFDLAAAVNDTRDRWREIVNMIDLVGATEDQMKIFYTSFYHLYMMPTDWVEANGLYHGFDHEMHDPGVGRRYYTDFSLWDTFRTWHPLMDLIEPAKSVDFLNSLIAMYQQGGDMPRWPCCEGYTGCMLGSNMTYLFAQAYLKGLTGWDVDLAYEGCRAQAVGSTPHGRSAMEQYLNVGWCCEDVRDKGTSHTLEYSYSDAALSWWAAAMGETEDAERFLEQSHNYRNHWDPEVGFLRGRNCDGSWVEPFVSWYPFSEQYVEGNAWHWTFYVPHDPAGLIALFGGNEAFVEKLNWAFEQAETGAPIAWLPDLYYWHGNEMSMFHVYMFLFAGRPDLTQKWSRWILENKYRPLPGGYDGNDDAGTMTSWYMFASLGFMPLAGSDLYVVGSPLFDGATLHLPGGDFAITVDGNSDENVYVQSVELNGAALAEPWFTHADIVNGGSLHFVMGPDPSDWGVVE